MSQVTQDQTDSWILHFMANAFSVGAKIPDVQLADLRSELSEECLDIFDYYSGISPKPNDHRVEFLDEVTQYTRTGRGGPLRNIYRKYG